MHSFLTHCVHDAARIAFYLRQQTKLGLPVRVIS